MTGMKRNSTSHSCATMAMAVLLLAPWLAAAADAAAATAERAPAPEAPPEFRVLVDGREFDPFADPEYRVWVNGREVRALKIPAPTHHDTQLPDDAVHPYWAALFDAQGAVTVRIESDSDLSATRILPLSRGIRPSFPDDGSVEFTAAPPFTVSVEPRRRHGALVVSAKTPDPDPPRPDDPDVMWFGPGYRHFDKPLELRSGQTLYLAPGAYVDSAVHGSGTNITIRGHGILSGQSWPHGRGPAHDLVLLEGADLAIRDITVVGSFHWTLVFNNATNAVIEGVNVLNGRVLNDDGIDVCRSRDVTIRDCFVRSQDDCICAKYWCEGLTVENCTLWADVANIFRIGFETDGPPHRFRDIRIRGIDVLHQAVQNARGWQNAVKVQASNGTEFGDILIDGMRLDSPAAWDRLAHLETFIARSKWRQDKVPGFLCGVVFRNVSVPADAPDGADCVIAVRSHDAEHAVGDVANECDDPRIRIEYLKRHE